MDMPKKIVLQEVGPRDGFQNIKTFIPTETKIDIIRRLLGCGIRHMQISSFVSPKAIPQMADAKTVVETILPEYPDVDFNALVPNLRGASDAVACGIRSISYSASVSASHNMRNNNRTHEKSFEDLQTILNTYPDLNVTFGVATAFGCPFEGETPLDDLLRFCEKAVKMGIRNINLSDTIGVAYPTQVETFIQSVLKEFPGVNVGLHIHDTRNNGMLNAWVGIQAGASCIHGSVGGLGGCPFAPGASGNLCTEDVVYLLDRCGIETGVDFEKIMEVSRFVHANLHGCYSGHHLLIPEDVKYPYLKSEG